MGNWEAPRHFSTPEDFLPSKAAVILEYYTDKEIQMLEEGFFGDMKAAYTKAKADKTGFGGVLAGLKGTAAAGAEAASAALTPKDAVGAMAAQGDAIKKIETIIAAAQTKIADAEAVAATDLTKKTAIESAVSDLKAKLNALTADLPKTKADYEAAKTSGFMQSLVGRLYGKKDITEGYRRNNSRRNLSALAFQDYINEQKGEILRAAGGTLKDFAQQYANNGAALGIRGGVKTTMDALGNPLINGHQVLQGGHHLASHISRAAGRAMGMDPASLAASKLNYLQKLKDTPGLGRLLPGASNHGTNWLGSATTDPNLHSLGGHAASAAAGGHGLAGAAGGHGLAGAAGAHGLAGIGAGTIAAGALGVAAVGAAVAAGVAGSRLKKRREAIQVHMNAANSIKTDVDALAALMESRAVRNLRRAVRSAVHEGLLRNTNR